MMFVLAVGYISLGAAVCFGLYGAIEYIWGELQNTAPFLIAGNALFLSVIAIGLGTICEKIQENTDVLRSILSSAHPNNNEAPGDVDPYDE